jgi:hypothetical protein
MQFPAHCLLEIGIVSIFIALLYEEQNETKSSTSLVKHRLSTIFWEDMCLKKKVIGALCMPSREYI